MSTSDRQYYSDLARTFGDNPSSSAVPGANGFGYSYYWWYYDTNQILPRTRKAQ